MKPILTLSTTESAELLLPFVEKYHLFEGVEMTAEVRSKVIEPLLGESNYGRIWLVSYEAQCIGYLAVCFCYSIEFGGRDAFIDEFYLDESYRGKGIGTEVLKLAFGELKKLSVKALHLEVAKSNSKAIGLYRQIGFAPRDKYDLYTFELAAET
jgi:ribosomal protein S18 acetylase RimI-like enzyme